MLKKSSYFFGFALPFSGLEKQLWNLAEPEKNVDREEESKLGA